MKLKHLILILIAGSVIVACSKPEEPKLDPSTPITVNGTTYNSKGYSFFDYGGGSIELTDSAISNDHSKVLWIIMSFNLTTSKPTSGNYTFHTDSNSLVTPGAIEFNFYENTVSGKPLFAHKILYPANGNVTVTNLNDKVSLKFGSQNLVGLPFDTVTGVSSGPQFNSTMSAGTITEE